jgi:hypothetical protein
MDITLIAGVITPRGKKSPECVRRSMYQSGRYRLKVDLKGGPLCEGPSPDSGRPFFSWLIERRRSPPRRLPLLIGTEGQSAVFFRIHLPIFHLMSEDFSTIKRLKNFHFEFNSTFVKVLSP